MKTPLTSSMRGSSQLFDHFIYSNLSQQNKFIRYGMTSELNKEVSLEITKRYPPPRNRKNQLQKPVKINSSGELGFNNLITKFSGAYVKQPRPLIRRDKSITMDLDQTSQYPSIILQNNISFDVYKARIIPPTCYTVLNVLEQTLGKSPLPEALPNQINQRVLDYVDNKKLQKKKDKFVALYYIILYLFDVLVNSGLTFDRIYNPSLTHESILLRSYLVPLLDAIHQTHPENSGYNQFAYDYLLMDNNNLINKYPYVYILMHPNESDSCLVKYKTTDSLSFIKNYIMTMAGTLFYKHDTQIGLFAGFLQETKNRRKYYQRLRDEAESKNNSYEKVLNNNRQKSTKVVMNTTYGLYGQNTFRYSDHWLAQSITSTAVMTIKIVQYIVEEHLKYKYDN